MGPLDAYFAEYGRDRFYPEIAGKYDEKNLVICGDAECVWDDLEQLGFASTRGRGKVEKDGWDIMTVNKIVEVMPGHIEHAYSNEPHLLNMFIAARRNEYKKEFHGPRHTHSCNKGAKWLWPLGGWGTSGLGACLVGIGLGYDRIVLCGLPLDDGPHNGEPHWRKCRFETSEAADQVNGEMPMHWKKARDLAFDGKVKSMSGRTKKWLG